MSNDHSSLHRAKANKEDEFYTKWGDISNELQHYTNEFIGKKIHLPCDTDDSHFVMYFKDNENVTHSCEDFRDQDWSDVDVIVTNPPFSLFREFLNKLITENKKFLVLGSLNMITYKEVYNLIRDGKIWLGYNSGDMEFEVPSWYEPRKTRYREEFGKKYRSMGNICWFTNIGNPCSKNFIELTKTYNKNDYPKYDNYDAIEVSKVADIPKDYEGVMGVPMTFLTKYNPNQFKIVGFRKGDDGKDLRVNGKDKYFRILIERVMLKTFVMNSNEEVEQVYNKDYGK